MKKVIQLLVLVAILAMASIAAAANQLATGSASATKGNTSVNVIGDATLRVICSADCTFKPDGRGAGYLIKANLPESIPVNGAFKSAVFGRTSSATPTGIYWYRVNYR